MMLMQSLGIFGITFSGGFLFFTFFCFMFGLGFGGAMVLMSACFLKAFGSVNLGSVRGFSGMIVVPLQPVGIFFVGRAFDLNFYLEAFQIMGLVTLIGFIVGSRIIIPKVQPA